MARGSPPDRQTEMATWMVGREPGRDLIARNRLSVPSFTMNRLTIEEIYTGRRLGKKTRQHVLSRRPWSDRDLPGATDPFAQGQAVFEPQVSHRFGDVRSSAVYTYYNQFVPRQPKIVIMIIYAKTGPQFQG